MSEMKMQQEIDNRAFKYSADQRFYEPLTRQFMIIQDKLGYKYFKYLFRVPFYSNIRFAKIHHCEKGDIIYRYSTSLERKITLSTESIADTTRYSLYNKSLDNIDGKNVIVFINKMLYWAANFGFHLDFELENVIMAKEREGKFFIFLPTLFKMEKELPLDSLSLDRLQKYRTFRYKEKVYSQFFAQLMSDAISTIKPNDPEFQGFDKMKNAKMCQPDYYTTNFEIYNKLWRNSLRYSLQIYNFNTRQATLLRDFLKREYNQIQNERRPNNSGMLTRNFLEFYGQLNNLVGVNYEFQTSFARQLQKVLKTEFRAFSQPSHQRGTFPIKVDVKVDLTPSRQRTATALNEMDPTKAEYWGYPTSDKIYPIKTISSLHKENLLYDSVQQNIPQQPQAGQPRPAQNPPNQTKTLAINSKVELLEDKYCYIFKTQIPEIQFSIDTADDIMFLTNIIQKDHGAINLFIDDTRRLSIYSTIVVGFDIPILESAIRTIDMHTIYYYLLVDFNAKNIQQGRQIKEHRYQAFVDELFHICSDYENDFNDFIEAVKSDTFEKSKF